MVNKPNKHGGTRRNAGAKPRYKEPTKTIAFRCPISKIPEVKQMFKDKMQEYRISNSINS